MRLQGLESGQLKKAYRTVTDDQSVLAYAKFVGRTTAAGALVTAATLETQLNLIDLQVNGGAESDYGTYTGNSGADNQVVFVDANIATVQALVDALNGRVIGQPAGLRRWRASLGDFRPGFAIGNGDGLAVAAANALLGLYHAGVQILADSSGLAVANTMSASIGGPTTIGGTGPQVPDNFESGYTSTVAGVVTPVREARRKAESTVTPLSQTIITAIHFGAVYASNAKVISVFDINNTLIFQYAMGAAVDIPANVLSEDNPIEGPPGSPLFVEAVGSGALTDGALSIHGWVRVA